MDSENKPEISIITPVYNGKRYLNRCIESILEQTFRRFELILIDDGSTDGSAEMCDAWAAEDDRIVVIHQKNAGAGAARNRGLSVARGEYIGFVDSDDWIGPDMYELLYAALQKYPEAGLAECETQRTSEEQPEQPRVEGKVNFKLLDRDQLYRQFFRVNGGESNYGIWNKLIPARILKEFSFVEGTICEDVMATYYLYSHVDRCVKVGKKLYYYFQNQGGVTRKKVTAKDLEYVEAFRRIYEDMKGCRPELREYAEINHIRAHFTILTKMKLVGFDKRDPQLSAAYKEMKQVVRRNFGRLLKWNMPLSRKLLLVLVCL